MCSNLLIEFSKYIPACYGHVPPNLIAPSLTIMTTWCCYPISYQGKSRLFSEFQKRGHVPPNRSYIALISKMVVFVPNMIAQSVDWFRHGKIISYHPIEPEAWSASRAFCRHSLPTCSKLTEDLMSLRTASLRLSDLDVAVGRTVESNRGDDLLMLYKLYWIYRIGI